VLVARLLPGYVVVAVRFRSTPAVLPLCGGGQLFWRWVGVLVAGRCPQRCDERLTLNPPDTRLRVCFGVAEEVANLLH
jgi:hypothetical protein